MNITYKNAITVDEVNAIRKSIGWRQQHPDQLQEQLDTVDLIISAYDKDIAVGVAIGQGYILIMPEYQYQGVENEFMKRIIDHTRNKLKPGYGTQIDIRAFGDKQIALYEGLGFQISTAEQRGVPMHICVTNQIELTDKMFKQMEFKEDTSIYSKIRTKEPIIKGWSEDKKYCVTTTDGTKYLLRITPISRYETRKSLFTMLEQVAALGIPMCTPVEFGTCDEGVYSIQSWVDGEDLENTLPRLSEAEQYVMGFKSGEILQKMHSIPAPQNEVEHIAYRKNWCERFNRKADRNIKLFHDCELKIDGGEHFIKYIEQNRHLLENRPQCFQHGDYHVGNMMIENGELKIIDFDRYDFGDPWEEFNRIVWSAAASPYFATGQLHGYFGGEPPEAFFKLLAFYIASTYIGGLSWAIGFGQEEIDSTLNQAKDILKWFNNFKNPVPTWYLKDLCVQYIDEIPYKLKAPFDFSFMAKYGKVFKVFDEQGSGNIAFSVQNGDKKYFIKFAGAPKPNYIANRDSGEVDTVSAIELLKKAVPLYTDLAHQTLIKFISAEEIGGGYAAIFEWEDAIGIEPKDSPDYMKFMQMPIEKKVRAFEDIVEFHIHVADKGYVALDFYDGSILYDYNNEKVIICDIDLYQKSPFVNVGSLGIVGSARYVSPEECVKDAVMDEITNVYTMGATAFALFAYGNRSLEAWTLNLALYDVAKKAVSDERDNRQQSIEQFLQEWRAAKNGK